MILIFRTRYVTSAHHVQRIFELMETHDSGTMNMVLRIHTLEPTAIKVKKVDEKTGITRYDVVTPTDPLIEYLIIDTIILSGNMVKDPFIIDIKGYPRQMYDILGQYQAVTRLMAERLLEIEDSPYLDNKNTTVDELVNMFVRKVGETYEPIQTVDALINSLTDDNEVKEDVNKG